MIYVGVAVAGAVGAVCRYVVDRVVQRRLYTVMPTGTLVVNVTGSFVGSSAPTRRCRRSTSRLSGSSRADR